MSKSNYAAVGGQAVMEGIMMRSPTRSVLAVRKEDGTIVTEEMQTTSVRQKYKILRLPVVRGCVAFVESLVIGYKALMRSAEIGGLEEGTKGNKFLEGLLSVVATVLGVGIALVLFLWMPQTVGKWFQARFPDLVWARVLLEGLIRIALYVLYILATSLMKDIKTLYQYHGAEHKTIFCIEAKEELTVENVRAKPRLHPRCGTSFIFLVFFVSILFFTLLHAFVLPASLEGLPRLLVHLALLPILAGLTFEVQQWTGRHDNLFVKIISAPGKALQKITTAEPTDAQMEVAICALNESLKNEEGEVDYSLAFPKKKQ